MGVLPTVVPQAIATPETFQFETAQLKRVSRQVVEVRTFKKLSWSGFEDVKENHTRTIEEWPVQKKSGQAKRFIEELGNDVKLEMVEIPGGEFMMGALTMERESMDCERPQHLVEIPSFYMGRYPVSQAQYEAMMHRNPSYFKGKDLPVENVTWKDAQDFCRRLNEKKKGKYGLPSESQWEYACRAGTTTPFYFGETISTDVANYRGDYTYGDGVKGKILHKTTPIGSLGVANSFGLYDMHGNVWEWCEDTWHYTYSGAPSDGSAWIDEDFNKDHILRGGSWLDIPHVCRSAHRYRCNAGGRNSYIGFRVVYAAARTV
jgi:formylglycine-generating enzyme required for sulfatase activity